MDEKIYPILDEEKSVDMVNEPEEGFSSRVAVPDGGFKYPGGYDGFYTEDSAELEDYKSKLIAEAMNDGNGIVKEPAAAITYQEIPTGMAYSDDYVPVSGPKTIDEAITDIEQSERDFAEGNTLSWHDVRQAIEDRIQSYAN